MKQVSGLMAFDSFELGTQRTITPEGFLVAPANIARSGVQLYRSRELGLDKYGLPPEQIVRLHRPDEEIFNPATMASFEDKPVINGNHTTTTAENWKELAVGDVRGLQRNGNLLAVQKMIVRDKPSVDDVQSGKKYLSIGYKFDLDMTPGTTATGEAYDGLQRNIVGNHVLITDSPRGGSSCSIADSTAEVENKEQRKMKKITVDGIPVEVGDSEAGIIETLITQRDAARNAQPSITLKVGDASKTITGGDALISEITGRDARIIALEAQIMKPEALQTLIHTKSVERTKVLGDSVKMVADFKADDAKTTAQIQRDVVEKVIAGDQGNKALVEAVLAGKTVGDASDDQIAVAFNALSATFKTTATNGADAAVAAALTTKTDAGDTKSTSVGRAAFIERSNKAWQN